MDTNIELVICRGIPASGKSTFSKQWVGEKPKERIRVCRDDIRRMLGPYRVPQREMLVTEIELDCTINGLLNGYSVILDATNLNEVFLERFLDKVSEKVEYPHYKIVYKDFFDVSLEECIKRDKEREFSVGEEVVTRFYQNYRKTIKNE